MNVLAKQEVQSNLFSYAVIQQRQHGVLCIPQGFSGVWKPPWGKGKFANFSRVIPCWAMGCSDLLKQLCEAGSDLGKGLEFGGRHYCKISFFSGSNLPSSLPPPAPHFTHPLPGHLPLPTQSCYSGRHWQSITMLTQGGLSSVFHVQQPENALHQQNTHSGAVAGG